MAQTGAKAHVPLPSRRMANRVSTVTGREYKDEPAILAWNLMNEPRCVVSTGTGQAQPMAC